MSRRSSAPESGTTTFERFAFSCTRVNCPAESPLQKSNREHDRTASNHLDDGSSQGRAHEPKADIPAIAVPRPVTRFAGHRRGCKQRGQCGRRAVHQTKKLRLNNLQNQPPPSLGPQRAAGMSTCS